ncbi:MAG: proteic killer suppression protein [Phenylobacterium sp.]|jgi:proteic killer suppression protein
MIKSFKDKKAQTIFTGTSPKGFPANIAGVARRKLRMLSAAKNINDLRSPPGNRLEALSGNRKGQYSIRINNQFRICFTWNNGAENVEIVDYH